MREKALLISRSLNDRQTKHYEHLTHAYVHWLADVHFAGFAPAFALALCDSEYARNPPVPIASAVRRHSKKQKKTNLRCEKSLTNCPLSSGLYDFLVGQILLVLLVLLGGQFLADFQGKNLTFIISTVT